MIATVKHDLTLLKEAIAHLEEILNDPKVEPDELAIEAEEHVACIEILAAAIKDGIN